MRVWEKYLEIQLKVSIKPPKTKPVNEKMRSTVGKIYELTHIASKAVDSRKSSYRTIFVQTIPSQKFHPRTVPSFYYSTMDNSVLLFLSNDVELSFIF